MKNILRKLLCLTASMIMAISLCAVSASAAAPKLSKTKVDLPIGYYINLKVSNPGSTVTWSVGDSDIVKLKASGSSAKITGQKTGSTYVYAKTAGKTLKCKVTVKQSFITSNYNNVEVDEGITGTLYVTVKGSKKIAISNSSSNVCSVSWGKWDGDKIPLRITAKGSGEADLTIYAKGYKNSSAEKIHVTVVDPFAYEQQTTEEMTDEVIELVNEERNSRGLSSLEKDDTLTDIANLRAEEIVELFDHNRPDGSDCFTALKEAGVSYYAAGENIAAYQINAEDVMYSWMHSPGHKKNILSSDFKNIGVGCFEHNGRYYWVQVFTG